MTNIDYKLIPLHGKRGEGKSAKVSPEDYDKLSKFRWHLNNNGYAQRRQIGGETTLMHRLIIKPPKQLEIDHINHDKLDNTRANLRIVTSQQNIFNKQPHKDGTSKFKGVYPHSAGVKKKWVASITKDGEQLGLGYFRTEEGAALAYNKAALELFGEFAYLNDVTEEDIPKSPPVTSGRSGFRGVTVANGGFVAWITKNRKGKYIGTYETAEGAARAVDEKVRELYGEDITRLNFPTENKPAPARKAKTNKSKTGFRGVFPHTNNRFTASITHNYKQKHIGVFETAEEAARAYDEKAKHLKGSKAILNFPCD